MANQQTHLDPATLAELRLRLESEHARLLRMDTQAETRTQQGANGSMLADEPSDYGDQGLELTQEDTEQALRENQQVMLAQVEHALERLHQGTYGLSEVTGRPIPRERLQVLPWATTNVEDGEH